MSEQKATNITWHHGAISKADREKLLGQKGVVIWYTGYSGSGKSTLATAVEKELYNRNKLCYILDGDNVRHGLNKNLGFSALDREENIRRIGEVARLFAQAGIIVMTAFISPYRRDRQKVRELLKKGEFIEVYLNASLAVAESRDPKGLYKKARAGEIQDFTGISAPYEEPIDPELVIHTGEQTVEQSVSTVIAYLENRGIM